MTQRKLVSVSLCRSERLATRTGTIPYEDVQTWRETALLTSLVAMTPLRGVLLAVGDQAPLSRWHYS